MSQQTELAGPRTELSPDLILESNPQPILSVDLQDDFEVRQLIVGMLERLGSVVDDFSDGESAQFLLSSRERIEILLTDVLLSGGLTGLELAGQARQVRPDLKVLFMSGYAAEVLENKGAHPNRGQLIQEPFQRGTLAGRIRQARISGSS